MSVFIVFTLSVDGCATVRVVGFERSAHTDANAIGIKADIDMLLILMDCLTQVCLKF